MLQHRDFLEIGTSPDLPTLRKRVEGLAQRLEFDIFTAAVVWDRPGCPIFYETFGNVPDDYQNASREADRLQRDPVLHRLKKTSVPFFYDQSLYVTNAAGDLWEEQAPFGFSTGAAVALHIPDGKHFLLGVDRQKPLPRDESARTQLLADLQLFAVFAQESALHFMLPREESAKVHLTRREVQVLQWTMEAKSAGVIGDILGISERAVKFHISNVMAKFSVTSKHQAVLRAIQLGIL